LSLGDLSQHIEVHSWLAAWSLQHIEVKYEEEKRKCLAELESVRKRAGEKEAAVQKAATKHIDSLSMQVCAFGEN
jgi:hypothetical protein